ncbi:MAG: hypothetical protein AAF903_06160 [Pseudomonadota bacterium]
MRFPSWKVLQFVRKDVVEAMRYIWDFSKIVVVMGLATYWFANAAYAQQVRTFTDKPITVRLCPAQCIAVNGHSYKPGGTATILERKKGWARVSAYLDRGKLVPNFGDKITAKPALWVPLSAFKTETAAAPTPKPKQAKRAAKPRRVSVIDQLARLRRPATPTFRPGKQIARTPAPEPVQETQPEPQAVPEPEVVERQQPAPQPQPAPKPVEVVRSEPIPTQPAAPATSSGTLTWEQVQARLAQQQAAQAPTETTASSPETGETEAARRARLEGEARRQEQARVAQQEAQRQAALKAEKERLAKLEEQARARRAAEEAERKRVAEAAAAVNARLAAAQAKNEEIRQASEARRQAEASRQQAAQQAREKAREEARARQAAREATNEAERKRLARAAAERQKVTGNVGYTPPKDEAAAQPATPAAPTKPEEQQVAVVLPPKAPRNNTPQATEAEPEIAKVEEPEPVYKAADSQPISFGERPKKLTKALLDRRLRKLPGRKSKVPREIVIAMRHYALGLLQSGECNGIARGGPSTTPNMIYIVCTDDPNYLRQFPIVEQTW